MICFKSVRLYVQEYFHVKIQDGMYNIFVGDMVLYKDETEEEI